VETALKNGIKGGEAKTTAKIGAPGARGNGRGRITKNGTKSWQPTLRRAKGGGKFWERGCGRGGRRFERPAPKGKFHLTWDRKNGGKFEGNGRKGVFGNGDSR